MDLKRKLLALAIAIVLVSFIAVGIDTFYKEPKNNCYDESSRPKAVISNCELFQEPNKTSCFIQQQIYYENQSIEQQRCYEAFQPIDNLYKRNVFIILIILGVLCVVLGLLVKKVQALSFGLMLGGLISIIYGIIRYWAQMNEYLRFIVLGILLAILIWISYKKLKD